MKHIAKIYEFPKATKRKLIYLLTTLCHFYQSWLADLRKKGTSP